MVAAVSVSVVCLLLAMLYTMRLDTTPEAVVAPTPRALDKRARKVYSLPRPESDPEPVAVEVPVALPAPTPEAEPIPREASLLFNNVAYRAIGDARAECVDPWMESDGPEEAEFALNALVVDGAVADIELLTVVDDLPDDVVSCIREVAWDADWPEFEMSGEVRYQRSVHASRRSPMSDDL